MHNMALLTCDVILYYNILHKHIQYNQMTVQCETGVNTLLLNKLRTSSSSEALLCFYCMQPCWDVPVKVPVKTLLSVMNTTFTQA